MAIIIENSPYFVSYTPTPLSEDEVVVTSINQMVSYSILPSDEPVIVNQPYGMENFYCVKLSIKNLTKNVTLQIELLSKESLFDFTEENGFTLSPREVREITISINKEKFNSFIAATPISENITLKITNIENGTYAIKDLLLQNLDTRTLPIETNIE